MLYKLQESQGIVLLFTTIVIQYSVAAIVRRSIIDSPPLVPALPKATKHIIFDEGVKLENNDSDTSVPPRLIPYLDDGVDGESRNEGDEIEKAFESNPEEATQSRKKRKLDGERWPNAVVPYEFSQTHGYSEPYKEKIRQAMKWWSDSTCIRFREDNSAPVRLSISNIHGCSSYVGYQPKVRRSNNGKQLIKLGQNTCFTAIGTLAHELGHSLGLIHEQSRPDRDQHIDIHVDKIHGDSIHNFQTYYDAVIPEGVRYDLNSIMHYDPQSFAKYANRPTMTAKNSNKNVLMGQRSALSYYDIMAVNKEYCRGNCVNNCVNEGYAIERSGRCMCVCPEGLTGSRCERVDSGSSCGGIITLRANEERTITTPNHPRNHGNVKCVWLITAPSDYLVEINLEDLELANNGGTCQHNVEIRNNVLGQRGDIICGTGAVGPFDTRLDHQNNQMMVIFDATDRTASVGRGFKAKVKAFKDGCLSSPCENGGTCLPSGSDSFSCICQAGYIGTTCSKANDAAVNCDFASNLCMFRNDGTDQLDMRRMFISTKYMETVKRDHNSNRFFVAAPAEFQTGLGDEARLISPVINSDEVGKRCLRFSYHMNGAYQAHGQLKVTARNVRGSSNIPLFEKNGAQGSQWQSAAAEIHNSGDFEVVFTIRTSTIYPYNSLIALDDISIEPRSCSGGPCANNPCRASGGTCVEPKSGGYYCLCPPGSTGTLCDSYDVDGFTCEFEMDETCGWSNSNNNNFAWANHFGAADVQRRTGPLAGAGGGGSYMLADTSSSQAGVGRIAQLISPKLNINGQLCVEFYYHMWGTDIGSLSLKTKSRHSSTTQQTWSGSQSTSISNWRLAQVTIRATLDSQLIFEAVSGAKHRSDIAIDKVKVSRGSCGSAAVPTTTSRTVSRTIAADTVSIPSPSSRLRNAQTSRRPPTTTDNIEISRRVGSSGPHMVACNFEDEDSCSSDFVNIPSENNHYWIRHQGSTASTGTGPSSAYQGRYYMYSEASDLLTGESNLLTTHLIYNSDKKACVTFYYSMFGVGMGTLKVQLKREYGEPQDVWIRNGDQSSSWQRAEIDIDMNNYFYQIMFRAVRGDNYQSDIAIDDIVIRRNTCDSNRQVTTTTLPDQPRINIVCDFEDNHLCSPNIRQSRDDDFDWIIHSGGTPTSGTGPTRAVSGSRYIMIEASSRREEEKARIETATIPANSGVACLKMYYHMKGSGIGQLSVSQKYPNNQRRNVFSRSGDQGDEWHSMEILLNDNSRAYKVEIEAQLSSSGLRYAGDIALDNFSLTSGTC